MFKIVNVYQIFHFQWTCICPNFGIVMQHTWKVSLIYIYLTYIFPCLDLSKCNVVWKSLNSWFGACPLLWKLFTWRNLCWFLHVYMNLSKWRFSGVANLKSSKFFPWKYNFSLANAFQSVLLEKTINLGRCSSFESDISGKHWKIQV